MFFQKHLDIHSAIHFVGCGYLTFVFYIFGVPNVVSMTLAFAFGLIWEYLDECNKRYRWTYEFLDHRGADIGDMIVDFLGVLIAGFLIYIA